MKQYFYFFLFRKKASNIGLSQINDRTAPGTTCSLLGLGTPNPPVTKQN